MGDYCAAVMNSRTPFLRPMALLAAGGLVAMTYSVSAVAASSHSATTTTSVSTLPGSTTTLPTTTTTPPTTTTTPPTTTTTVPRTLTWPAGESAAVLAPEVAVAAVSPYQPRVAIASLTKMMTAWVLLHRMPLTFSQRGPCHVVNAHDVALYRHDVATGQSSAAVALGERLCEGTLLRGLLIHSAGNYAEILVELAGLTDRQFIAVMNRTAVAMGLHDTHYVDITGIGAGDRSTARDQVHLAQMLMSKEPIVDRIVTMPSIRLPVAGVLNSYTPFVGQGGVVGVKSGYTDLAGGCDVMAIVFRIGTFSTTVYAAVLGDHGPNAIVGAAQVALNLAREIRLDLRVAGSSSGRHLAWAGSPGYVVTTTTTPPTTTTTTSTTTTTTVPTTTTTLP